MVPIKRLVEESLDQLTSIIESEDLVKEQLVMKIHLVKQILNTDFEEFIYQFIESGGMTKLRGLLSVNEKKVVKEALEIIPFLLQNQCAKDVIKKQL